LENWTTLDFGGALVIRGWYVRINVRQDLIFGWDWRKVWDMSNLWKLEIETRYVTYDGQLGKSTHREILKASSEQEARHIFADRIKNSWQRIVSVEEMPTIQSADKP
jgi:hypothetical protein